MAAQSVAGPVVARGLPQVLRLPDGAGRETHLLRQGGQDLLQEGLHQVSTYCLLYSTGHCVQESMVLYKWTLYCIRQWNTTLQYSD